MLAATESLHSAASIHPRMSSLSTVDGRLVYCSELDWVPAAKLLHSLLV